MEEKLIYDISEVCKILNTTSRTLRFYEEKGIIQSTAVKYSIRRHYTKEQIANIRNVLALRTLGLSIKSIIELQKNNTDLKSAIIERRAQISAWIEEKQKEIVLLHEALAAIEEGKDIFEEKNEQFSIKKDLERDIISKECTYAIINGDNDAVYKYLSEKMKEYTPLDVFKTIRRDTLLPLGNFIEFEKSVQNEKHPNIIYHFIKYEKLGLKIKYVFHGEKIHGLWFRYYEWKEK